VDGMLNINLQKFGKPQAILIFLGRIFRRYMVGCLEEIREQERKKGQGTEKGGGR
jgi:hypothetical protein